MRGRERSRVVLSSLIHLLHIRLDQKLDIEMLMNQGSLDFYVQTMHFHNIDSPLKYTFRAPATAAKPVLCSQFVSFMKTSIFLSLK